MFKQMGGGGSKAFWTMLKKLHFSCTMASLIYRSEPKTKTKTLCWSPPPTWSAPRETALWDQRSRICPRDEESPVQGFIALKKVSFFPETLLICQTRLVLTLLSWQAQQGSPAPSAAWRWDVQEAGRRTRCLCPHTSRPAMTSCWCKCWLLTFFVCFWSSWCILYQIVRSDLPLAMTSSWVDEEVKKITKNSFFHSPL